MSQFYYDGVEGNIEIPDIKESEFQVIDIDPLAGANDVSFGAHLEVVPNFLTEAQQFAFEKDITVIGRQSEAGGLSVADFAIVTADKFISKNHCQITRKKLEDGRYLYQLGDAAPSKNGTFYNTDKNTQRLLPHVKVNLKDGDYFWIGNTKIVFHD
ncbi:FHA domain-containing protein [Niabella ginsengisoli]|uniref:FHA domain-containing protein n=1 Tax=Niabella ginsengisoli TaxID=522298 RepID=A0ABS9SJ19_9BACT|nr:FHA domain-containing protein [Niabella ginsengisoli]MCH5598331.1 FHA domain-containing protein [Niabella ginsengisoli]